MRANRKMSNSAGTIWVLIAVVAMMDIAAVWFGRFEIAWETFIKPIAACCIFATAGSFYNYFRKDTRLSVALTSTAQITAFTTFGAPLSYVAASAALPLWDGSLVSWDHHLGFSWQSLLSAMNNYPTLHKALALAYLSMTLQIIAIVVTMMFTDRSLRLQRFVIAFICTTLVSIALSAVMPAQGVWGQLHLTLHDHPAIAPVTQAQHLGVFNGLRDGTRRLLMAEGAEGIITFPSVHAALGMLFIFTLWPVKHLRWICVGLNGAMIVSTPVDGGHYFSDIIAGAMIATLCWIAIGRLGAIAKSHADETVIATPEIITIVPALDGVQQQGQTSNARVREGVI